VLDSSQNRAAFLKYELSETLNFSNDYKISPTAYHRMLMNNISLWEGRKFRVGESLDIIQAFYDERGNPSRARYADALARKADNALRRDLLIQVKSARPFLTKYDGEQFPIDF
jgi:hypothetical protein